MSTLPILLENGCCLVSTGEFVALSASSLNACGIPIFGDTFRRVFPWSLATAGFNGDDIAGDALSLDDEEKGASFSFDV